MERITEWEGSFLAAGAVLGEKAINGAVVFYGVDGVEVVDWSLKGNFSEKKSRHVDLGSMEIARALVRASGRGDTVVLFKDTEGSWSVYSPAGLAPVPEKYRSTNLPIDILFMAGQPVLVCARENMGFELLQLDGKPLPADRHDWLVGEKG